MVSIFTKRPFIKWTFMTLLLLINFQIKAQNVDVTGTVVDTYGKPLWKTTVTFYPLDFGKIKRTITDSEGKFNLSNGGNKNYKIIFTNIGYESDTIRSINMTSNNILVTLNESNSYIDEVIVLSHPKVPIIASKDTISYDLASFKGKDDKYLIETLSRIKGIRVSSTGNVYSHGEQITKIMLNDQDIFNGDVALLTRNLPVELLETAEVINDYGNESSITGIKGQATKILNIHTKNPNIKGGFGELYSGGGSKKSFILNGSANYFDDKNQISVNGGINNINKLNVLSTSVIDNSGNSGIGVNGLNKIQNYSLNARTKNSTNSTLYINADRIRTSNKSFGESLNTSILTNESISYKEEFSNTSNEIINNFNARYDYTNKNFSLNLSPRVRLSEKFLEDYREANFTNYPDSIGTYNLSTNTKQNEVGLESNLTYKFNKPKRSAGARIQFDRQENNENKSIYNDFNTAFKPIQLNIMDSNDKDRLSASVFYNDQITKNTILQISYNTVQVSDDLKRSSVNIDNIIIDSLGGEIRSSINTKHIDARLVFNYKNLLLDVIASYQNDYLKSQNNKIGYKNLSPSIKLVYSFDDKKDITFSFKKYSTLPSINQVITIPTINDPLFVYSGNSNILPQKSSQFVLGYKFIDNLSGTIFRANVDYQLINDKIISNSAQVIKDEAQQFVTLSNTNGYKRLSGDYFYSKNIGDRKTIDLIGSFSQDNNPQFIDNTLFFGKNLNIYQSLKFFWPITNYLNLVPSVVYRLSDIKYGISDVNLEPLNTFNLVLDASVTKGSLTFKVGTNKFYNTGYSGKSHNNFLLNSTISYKLFDGSCFINLEGIDLLNNNTAISRNSNNNNISEVYVNRLSRYIMLSAHIKIGKFK